MTKSNRFYTTTQAAAEVGMSPSSVRRLCLENKIGLQMANGRILNPTDLKTLRKLRKYALRKASNHNS